MTMKMEMSREDGLPIADPAWDEVEAALAAINPHEGRGFVTLTRNDGSYVQTAGAKLRVIVEYRQSSCDGSFHHYILGKAGRLTKLTSINSSVGIIQLQVNEVLTVRDATGVFRVFYQTGTIPTDLVRRDVTSRFV